VVARFVARLDEEDAAEAEPWAPPDSRPYTAVVTSHVNPYLSGVAKFSRLLAARLGVPCIPLAEAGKLTRGPLLLSLKLSDGSTSDLVLARRHLDELRESGAGFDLFLHAYGFTPEARAYARAARRVFAGNAEMAWMLASDDIDAVTLWCPALVDAGGVKKVVFQETFTEKDFEPQGEEE
jgi:hypothetical protein